MGSAAIAPPDVRDVTLALFGGRKTDIAPSDSPEGLCLDEQDSVYLPGEWLSRPALAKLYDTGALTAGKSVLYEKTYVQPNDVPLTLVLTSDGKLWVENIVTTPLAPASIGQFTSGLYAQSVTEFGREYIAFSDLLHGQGVPLQYDGTNLDRVTMDGPGSPIIAGDENISQAILAAPNGLLPHVNPTVVSGSESAFQITLIIAAGGAVEAGIILRSFLPNDQWQIAGVGAGYNGTFPIATCVGGPLAAQLTITYFSTTSGLAPVGAAGTAAVPYYTGISTITVLPPPTVNILIAGAGVAGYNGTWNVRVSGPLAGGVNDFSFIIPGVFGLAASGNGTWAIVGSVSVGQHSAVCMFLTRQGAITQPSPAFSWTAAGGKRAIFANLPIGPANVVARIIGLTGAGGANYFIIPATTTLAGTSTTVYATVVPDNTSSTVTIDFADNALFDAIAIDQAGNDLFDQVVIGPVLGFFAFASRLVCWGDYNKVENFLNMGFCGGFLSGVLTGPTGWNAAGNVGGTLVNGGSWASGMSWQITGDGTAAQKGLLSQSAYLDSFGDAIIQPSTQYAARFWAKPSAAGLAGSVTIKLSSASTGFSSTVAIAINTLNSTTGGFAPLTNFSLATPAAIPADLLLSVFETNLNNAATITLGELQVIFAVNPFRDNLSRWSYVNNPEAFAQTTGNLGPSDDASPIRCFALLRLSALLETAEGIHNFQDNDFEPDEWNVNAVTRSLGAVSLRAGDPGKFGTGDSSPDWTPVAAKDGVWIFAGSEFWKISQEISRGSLPLSQDPRKTWDDINWAAEQTIVIKNDPATRRCYFAVPMGSSVTPNGVFVLDYREMDTAAQIANAAPLHITLQGKMRSSDLARKWSYWNVSANDLEILIRPGNQRQIFFAGGLNANGVSFGNIYSLDPAKLTDDDYGAIAPFYTTYFFTDHETEQGLGIGSDMKLVKRIHAFIAGVGQVTITPLVNSLYNFMPGLSPRILVKDTDQSNFLKSDLEWTIAGLRGQRVAFRISVQPLPGATDVQLRVQKLIVGMMKDPVAQFRQSGV